MKELKKPSININKKDFINILINKTELSKTQVETGVEEILKFFEECFEKTCIIEIRGFGKWKCREGKVKFRPFSNLSE
jgi:nucleoid DNA-binding protein